MTIKGLHLIAIGLTYIGPSGSIMSRLRGSIDAEPFTQEEVENMSKPKLVGILVIFLFALGLFWGCSSEEEAKTNEPTSEVYEEKTPVEEPVAEIEAPKAEQPVTTTPEVTPASDGPAAEFLLQPGLWENPTKRPVRLTHEKHIKDYKIACKDCHHVYEEGENIWDETMPVAKCETCHNEPTVKGETKLPPEEKKKNLKWAFHENCRTCHKALKKENPETQAPVTCGKCHKKSDTAP
jgi:hypothetical protein